MDNDIIKLLGIKEAGIHVLKVSDTRTSHIVTIEKELAAHYCPVCGMRMYSKGTYKRRVNHPVMQDGRSVILEINQRRWQCTNPECRNIETDQFSFVEKRRRNTNMSDLLIVQAFKDHEASASSIARRFSVSNTHAITTFARYVDLPRRQLPEILCVDEVHLNISKKYKYALVLQDFVTGEPVDLVATRREELTLPYFSGIPIAERRHVRYIISDMYKPYLEYIDKYFPNAVSVVDSFHVIQLINRYFLSYRRKVQHELDARDRAEHDNREQMFHRRLPFKHSKEYLMLKKYHWMLLKNPDSIHYYTQPKLDKYLNRMMNTYDYFEYLYSLDVSFKERKILRDKYIAFNKKYGGDPKNARHALKELINLYRSNKYKMFQEISYTLEEFFEQIINSFVLVKQNDMEDSYQRRLSNGPIEALNRIPKDMKRIGRGYLNFEHIRNRFLFSQRKNAAILASPKPLSEVLIKIIQPVDE